MSDTLTFVKAGTSVSLVVEPIPGTVRVGGGHDDRGGGTVPGARAGYAMNGSCEVVIAAGSSGFTLSSAVALPSGVGPGDYTVTGAGRYAGVAAYQALLDVTIGGDSVQTATISWKGTYNPES